MTHPRPADDGPPPPWMGAPGYSPQPPNLAPHAPMPGAPPYPPYVEHPLPPVGNHGGTGYPRALGACAVWAAVTVLVVVVVAGSRMDAGALGYAVGSGVLPALIAAVPTWLVLRRRARAYWVVLLVALPFYVVLRVIIAAGAAAS